MTREGRSFKEQQQEQVSCLECGKELAKGSLVTCRQTQHGGDTGMLGSEVDKLDGGGNKPRTHRMAFPTRAGPRPYPVEGCSVRLLMRMEIRVHFWHRHVRDTVMILEEVNLPNPGCPLCDIMVPWKDMNGTRRRK